MFLRLDPRGASPDLTHRSMNRADCQTTESNVSHCEAAEGKEHALLWIVFVGRVEGPKVFLWVPSPASHFILRGSCSRGLACSMCPMFRRSRLSAWQDEQRRSQKCKKGIQGAASSKYRVPELPSVESSGHRRKAFRSDAARTQNHQGMGVLRRMSAGEPPS